MKDCSAFNVGDRVRIEQGPGKYSYFPLPTHLLGKSGVVVTARDSAGLYSVRLDSHGAPRSFYPDEMKREADMNESKTDIIGGFPLTTDNCGGCGKPLLVENAWMTDGCPCNSKLGVNSLNETRWRLLMQLQQQQSRQLESLAKFKAYVHQRLDDAGVPADPDSPHKAEGCRIGGRLDIVLANCSRMNG